MFEPADAGVDASRLAALLAFLASWDYAAESLAQHLLGESAGWAVVTALEAWKATVRVRLLAHVDHGRLMSSFASSAPQEAWSSVVRRLGASSDLRTRAAGAARGAGPSSGSGSSWLRKRIRKGFAVSLSAD